MSSLYGPDGTMHRPGNVSLLGLSSDEGERHKGHLGDAWKRPGPHLEVLRVLCSAEN